MERSPAQSRTATMKMGGAEVAAGAECDDQICLCNFGPILGHKQRNDPNGNITKSYEDTEEKGQNGR